MKILHLTLHRRYFDAIARGEKKIEYRMVKPFWEKRLAGQTYDEVHFRNGYDLTRPWMRVQLLRIERGEWETQPAFHLHLGAILELRNWIDHQPELLKP